MADIDGSCKGVCQSFIPQQWRKTKCKLCFRDIIEHTKSLTKQQSQELIDNFMNNNKTKCSDKISNQESIHGLSDIRETDNKLGIKVNVNKTNTFIPKVSQYNFNGSLPANEISITNEVDKMYQRSSEDKVLSPLDNSSNEAEDGISTPPQTIQKRRTRSYRKNSSNLLQFSAMLRSSNSSICSYNSELTDGYSDYDYDIPSITDDTDDYAEIQDVIDELHPEIKERMINERKMSRTKIFDLERELEGQQDYYRASEVAKDRQIKSLIREIEGLRLELTNVRAHENMLMLKCRHDLEGKSSRIDDLEQQVRSLQEEISKISNMTDFADLKHESLTKELERSHRRVAHLEDENRSTESRLMLAEDLQKNDRELLDVLRNQLSRIEEELQASQQCTRLQEDKLKLMDLIKGDLMKEQDIVTKMNKEMESLRQKVKRRDRHIEDLEDDNVKLQQLKTALDSQLAKKEFQMQKIERKLSNMQSDISRKNREISDLTGEKRTLEQVRRLTDLKLKDQMKNEPTDDIRDGENLFINSLEDRLKYMESRVKELELENENSLKEVRDIYDNLIAAEKQSDDYKTQLADMDARNMKLQQENKHYEKKIEVLHRKARKMEKEKKRSCARQQDAEYKLSQYREEEEYYKSSKPDVTPDDGSRMLQLKLQSTEAKLSMIEGNKGYLEAKVISLERKVHEKESEIQSLHDSMERDSGAPSQDLDRIDTLERENVMLQTRLDEVARENSEQRDVLHEFERSNQIMENTIKDLNGKLEQCTQRLKGLEQANHKLGREALRRSGAVDDSNMEELKAHNNELRERARLLTEVEELAELLELELDKEKACTQWYSEQNGNMNLKIAKMSDTIKTLEEKKSEFEKEIHQLALSNHDLKNDVKRLEEKLEIYSDLFGENSALRSSLKRHSYQVDNEEALIGNALSPLMEEIKEKDERIKKLQEAVQEKDTTVNALVKEVEVLETNLAAMMSEKLKQKLKDEDLTVTAEEFFSLLNHHERLLKQKDESFKRTVDHRNSDPLITHRDSHQPNRIYGTIDVASLNRSHFNKRQAEDMYEQIAQLEDLVSEKKQDFKKSSDIDLSGLDDLLQEVNMRRCSSAEKPENQGVVKPAEPKLPLMPSLITTKRRIIKLADMKQSS